MAATRPTFQAIVDAAIDATGATSAWLLADGEDDGLVVVATAGHATRHQSLGATVAAQGAKAYVLAAGQPTALLPQPGDAANADAGGVTETPPSLLAVPCGDDEVVGVLELSGKPGGANFDFGDIALVAALAQIAGAALLEDDAVAVQPASPAEIGRELTALAERNPTRYATVARLIEAVLSVES